MLVSIFPSVDFDKMSYTCLVCFSRHTEHLYEVRFPSSELCGDGWRVNCCGGECENKLLEMDTKEVFERKAFSEKCDEAGVKASVDGYDKRDGL